MSPTISAAASSGIASTSACVSMTASIETSSTTSRSQGDGAKGRARRQVLCQKLRRLLTKAGSTRRSRPRLKWIGML
jgi:hypothetical protein